MSPPSLDTGECLCPFTDFLCHLPMFWVFFQDYGNTLFCFFQFVCTNSKSTVLVSKYEVLPRDEANLKVSLEITVFFSCSDKTSLN